MFGNFLPNIYRLPLNGTRERFIKDGYSSTVCDNLPFLKNAIAFNKDGYSSAA